MKKALTKQISRGEIMGLFFVNKIVIMEQTKTSNLIFNEFGKCKNKICDILSVFLCFHNL
jgi:hypothetical protein